MNLRTLTELLAERLLIDIPPVGLAWLAAPPAGVVVLGKVAPSFCALWRMGERGVFFTTATHHVECLIGAYLAGFPLTAGQLDEAHALLDDTCRSEALPPDDLGRLTRAAPHTGGILYGPLWEMPAPPDVAVVWATLPQAAVLQELAGPLAWPGNAQGAVFGRPACGVVGAAQQLQRMALHEGCVGMRLYTELPRELCPVALPASLLGRLETNLATLTDGEQRIRTYLDRMRGARA